MSIEQRFYIINGASAMYNADFHYWTKLDWLAVMLFRILKDYNDNHQSELSFDSATPDIIPKGNF